MPDTTLLIKAAVLSLKRFTVPELCEHAGLRRPQVDPVLAELKKQKIIVAASGRENTVPISGDARAAHRPRGTYELTTDEAKVQAFANEVYRLRRVVAPAESETADIGVVSTELEELALLLDICDTATKAEPLGRSQLHRVERQIKRVHTQLEVATYKRGLNLRNPENKAHPIARAWAEWQECVSRLNLIIDRWEANPSGTALASVVSAQFSQIKKLTVISDASFLDSALFLWIFSRQPLKRAGLQIDCEVKHRDWVTVPYAVADQEDSVGFYNRNSSAPGLLYWADLSVYRGYALLSHASPFLKKRPATMAESEKALTEYLAKCGEDGVQPTIISIGGDTDWRFGDKLTPNVSRQEFKWVKEMNATAALERFRNSPHALFVGGLSQRLQAEKEGFVSVLDAGLKPNLFAINGLIYNAELAGQATAVLQSLAALWFDEVSKLKRSEECRRRAASGIREMLGQFRRQTSLRFEFDDFMFDQVFGSDEFEFFPDTPAEIARYITELQTDTLRWELGKRGHLKEVADTLQESNRALEEPRPELAEPRPFLVSRRVN